MRADSLTGLDIATLVVAVLGALTGIAALIAQVWHFALSGYRVRVTSSTAFLTAQSQWALSVDVANVGRMPVTINGAGVLFGDDQRIPLIHRSYNAPIDGPTFPHRLVDGDSATWVIDPLMILDGLRREGGGHRMVCAYIRLATGEKKTARRSIDIEHIATL